MDKVWNLVADIGGTNARFSAIGGWPVRERVSVPSFGGRIS